MSQYISLAALKQSVAIEDTNDDALLTSVIFRASARVDSFLAKWRVGYVGFASSSNSRTGVGSNTRVYDGTGDDTLFIDDFQSVSAVSVDTTSVSSNAWRLWPYNQTPKRAIIYESVTPDIIGRAPSHWSRGTANIAVTGYAGLNHVPDDVAQTTLAVAIIYWRRYQQGEPEPVVSPEGLTGFLVQDPEVDGILASGLDGWVQLGVWGA